MASTPAAKVGVKPDFFIMGMVKAPVTITLAMGVPEMEPNRALATMEDFAAPPRVRLAIKSAMAINSFPVPLRSINSAIIINSTR